VESSSGDVFRAKDVVKTNKDCAVKVISIDKMEKEEIT